jgi:hypothetical protein
MVAGRDVFESRVSRRPASSGSSTAGAENHLQVARRAGGKIERFAQFFPAVPEDRFQVGARGPVGQSKVVAGGRDLFQGERAGFVHRGTGRHDGRVLAACRRDRETFHRALPLRPETARPKSRTPDVVEFAVCPQVGQAVLACRRSYSSSGPKFSAGGQASTAFPTCEALAIEGNGPAHFPRQCERGMPGDSTY